MRFLHEKNKNWPIRLSYISLSYASTDEITVGFTKGSCNLQMLVVYNLGVITRCLPKNTNDDQHVSSDGCRTLETNMKT